MDKDYLVLKRASASRQSGEWNEDDFDVLANGIVVGGLFKSLAAPAGMPWLWVLAFGHYESRHPTRDYAATREAAMAAFAKSWRRGVDHGKTDDETQRTGSRDFVLRRDRH
jgi:hypothetical protein